LTTYLLSKHGVAADEFTVVKAGVATLPDILRQGGIDAGMALEPHGSSLVESGDAVFLVDFRSAAQVREHLGSLYPLTCLLVRQDVIDRSPQAVQTVATAFVWACKWLQTATADDILNLLPTDYIPEASVWRKSFAGYKDVFSPDGKNDVDGIGAVVAAQVTFGKLSSPDEVNIDALYTNQFWQVADQTPLPASVVAPVPVGDGETGDIVGKIVLGIVVVGILAIIIFLAIRRKPASSEET
jgi:NitT/TauT family transport system substrate-binding protein